MREAGAQVSALVWLEVERSGSGPDVATDFLLEVVVPHGVSPGFGNPDYTEQFFTSVVMSPETGSTAVVRDTGFIDVAQTFLFDPSYGPQSTSNVHYEPAVHEEHLFETLMTFRPLDGAGPEGGPGYRAYRAITTCAETGGGLTDCNGFCGSNIGAWDGADGAASAFSLVGPGAGEESGASAVPLPGALPLLAAGLAGPGVAGRRRRG